MFPFFVLGGAMAFIGYTIPKHLAKEQSKAAALAAEAELRARQEARDSVKESMKSPNSRRTTDRLWNIENVFRRPLRKNRQDAIKICRISPTAKKNGRRARPVKGPCLCAVPGWYRRGRNDAGAQDFLIAS
jgi:flagellar biosynthesis protein FlhA